MASPIQPTTSNHSNGSGLSISGALSCTPTESPLLEQPPASSPHHNLRRASLQAPGLVQYQPSSSILPSLPPAHPTIPASPTAEAHSQLQLAPTSMALGAANPNHVGEGAPLLVEFLLISGKRTRWTVGDQATVREVREAVWRGWPEEWRGQEESPPSAESLRLLYLGKFLDDQRTLAFYGLTPPTSPTPPPPSSISAPTAPPAPVSSAPTPTIIHLNIRPLVTEGDYQDDLLKPQKSSNWCSGCCIVC